MPTCAHRPDPSVKGTCSWWAPCAERRGTGVQKLSARAVPVLSLTAVLFGASACAGSQRAETQRGQVPPYKVTVAIGTPVSVPEEGLAISVVAVKDDRCPVEVQCVWAGHAAVTLLVAKAGASAEITIGTPAPASMKLPSEATYGSYRFALLNLEPGKSLTAPVAQSAYRATVQVSKQ